MASDASIYGLIKPYDPGPGPLELYGKAAQVRNLMGQGQLQDLQTQKLSRDLSEEQQVRELFRKYPDGKVPIGELFAASPTHAQAFQKTALEIQEKGANITHKNLESQGLQVKAIRDIAAQVNSDADMPAAREAAARVVGPDKVAQLPFFNTPFTPENKLRAITTADEHLKQAEAQRGREVTVRGQDLSYGKPQLTEGIGGYSWMTPPPPRTGPPATGAAGLPLPAQAPSAAPSAAPAVAPAALPIPGSGPTPKAVSTAAELRKEQDSALKPLDEVQQNITRMKQLLATGGPASAQQIQEGLTNVFDKNRAYSSLLNMNKNFGTLQGRAAGFIGRTFTGDYTDQQRKDIRDMLNEMENNVITPSRQRIIGYHKGVASSAGVPANLIPTPPGYADSGASGGWSIERVK